MKLKTVFVSILATLCLGMSACNAKDAPKSVEPSSEVSSEEPTSSEEPASSEEPTTSSEEPHVHAFGDWNEVTPATCTEKGLKERVCACGEKEQEEIDALGHLPKTEWEQTVAPTVDAEGEEVLKCERCGAVLETRKIDKLEPPAPEFETQVVDFSGTSGSGEHNAESLGAFVLGDLITAVSNVSKIYKSTGSSGAHPNSDGIIKTGTSSANGTMTLTSAKPIKKLVIKCHDFYAKSADHPTNSNKLSINGVEKLAPYNETGNGEDLEWEFTEPVSTIELVAMKRVYM